MVNASSCMNISSIFLREQYLHRLCLYLLRLGLGTYLIFTTSQMLTSACQVVCSDLVQDMIQDRNTIHLVVVSKWIPQIELIITSHWADEGRWWDTAAEKEQKKHEMKTNSRYNIIAGVHSWNGLEKLFLYFCLYSCYRRDEKWQHGQSILLKCVLRCSTAGNVGASISYNLNRKDRHSA